MPYNMWFVTTSPDVSPAGEWIKFVAEFRDDLRAELVAGTPDDWREITVREDDWWWFNFERRLVPPGSDTKWEELAVFRDWLKAAQPAVNTQWVTEYLTRVKTIYKFECSTSAPETNMDVANEIVRRLRGRDRIGLLYAELEGWMNELGAHITWEFSERVSGECLMAVRRPGGWVYFRMELGDPHHREAFKAGKVPTGLETKEYGD